MVAGLTGSCGVLEKSADEIQRGIPQRGTPAPSQILLPQSLGPDRAAQVGASGVFSSASSIDARYVEELENDFFDLEDKYDALARERNDLSMELEAKVRSIEELQVSLEQYKEKAATLERRCTHLEEEIKTYRERLRLPESDQGGVAGGTGVDLKASALVAALEGGEGSDDLKIRLNQVEQLCQDVMEENEALKEEIEEMQREIEEMHDHFQEEDRDSLREMQRDLEAANKTCRILQFKLRKAERRFEQVEAERASLEERLSRLESQLYSETDIGHIRTLEDELRIAKEVTTRLNNELDILEEKRQFYEDENHQLKDELQLCQNRRITSENEVDRLRLELDKLKCESRFAERGPLQVTDKKAGRQSTALSTTPPALSTEQNELIRALQTTKEREADLSEQLRFAEEELRKMNRRMAEAQADNNALSRQLERLSMQQVKLVTEVRARGESPRATASQVKKEFAATQQEAKRAEVDETAEKLKAAQEELENRKETDALITKRMRQLANELLTLKATYKEIDWLEKCNEAIEAQRDAENQVTSLKRRLLESSTDLPSSVVARIESRRPSLKSSESRAAMSKDWLLQKLDIYDKEMSDLETEISALRNLTDNLKMQSQKLGEEHAEFKNEADQREKDLRIHIENLEKKDFIVSNLLELMVQRTNFLQEQLEKSNPKDVDKESTTELKNLQEILHKEREKARILEEQLKSGALVIPRPMLSENERSRLKEIDVLKSQLEEKEEIIEDHESQIRDLRNRLERAKKMNDAMKILIDKDAVDSCRISASTSSPASAVASLENKQNALEISGYRKEIDSMRKEIAILQQKVLQIEKVREKLILENKDLQEELKLREDSLFDQDDELEKRNADLAKAKRALELMHVELNEARKGLAAARAQEGMSTKISTTLAENERLKSELRRLEEELSVTMTNLEKARTMEADILEKNKQLALELKNKENHVQEKEDLLNEVKKDSQRLDEELNSTRQAATEAQNKIKKLEATIVEQQKKQNENGNLGTDSASDSAVGRDSNRDSRRTEMDRLRRECTALRQERDEIAKEARRDRQLFEKRLQEACNKLNSLSETSPSSAPRSAVVGDLFTRATAEKQISKKLNLFNEHIAKQNSIISQLKIKNEIIQNKVLEYQRRYVNLKEQYEAEQEAWLSERVVLESKAKEQEERKNTIASTRKSLQEASIRLAEVELNFEKERQKFESELARLETEKSELKVQLAQLKEQQKLPKVLQRFSASPARSGHISMVNAAASGNVANTETARRLDSAERTIARLKTEIQNRIEAQSQITIDAIKEAEAARGAAECQMECLNEQLLQLNLYREQAELFRERLIESEQGADREYKIWTEEREDLLCRIEDSRISVEQWCIRLANREGIEGLKSEEIINDIVAEMERWRNCRQHMPTFQRRSHTSDTQSMMGESMLGTPASQPKTPLSASHRSTSVEWFNRSGNGGFRGSTVSLAGGISSSLARSVTPSLSRCGRSVSPDVSVRKITNYPDPTPGFLIRSRQPSVDSLGSVSDLSTRPFNSPGKPPLRQPISPARRKFFEESSAAIPSEPGSLKAESFTFPLSSSNIIIKHPAELRHATTFVPASSSNTESLEGNSSLAASVPPKKDPSPSVLSRISSKLTGSKTDLSRHKTPPKEKRQSPPKVASSSSPSKSPKQKKKSPPRTSPPKTTSMPSQKSASDSVKTSTTTPTVKVQPLSTKRRESEMIQSIASKLHSTAEASTKTPVSFPLKTSRSVSLTTPSISPSIMALRQKFGGK
nr:Prefoldin [Hymenolepis microstoma]